MVRSESWREELESWRVERRDSVEHFARGVGIGYIWCGVSVVVGVVRVGEWRLGAGSRHAGTGMLDSRY